MAEENNSDLTQAKINLVSAADPDLCLEGYFNVAITPGICAELSNISSDTIDFCLMPVIFEDDRLELVNEAYPKFIDFIMDILSSDNKRFKNKKYV